MSNWRTFLSRRPSATTRRTALASSAKSPSGLAMATATRAFVNLTSTCARVHAIGALPTRCQLAPARRYVKTDVRELIEDMVGKRKPFSASIPWLYIFVSSAGAILLDLVDFATFYLLPTWQDQLYAIVEGASCILVGTPMVPVIFLWCSSKQCRFGGKAPMILLAPIIMQIPQCLLITGTLSNDFTFCMVQFFCFTLPIGAFVFRDSIANLLGLNKQGRKAQKKQYVQLPTHSYGSNL